MLKKQLKKETKLAKQNKNSKNSTFEECSFDETNPEVSPKNKKRILDNEENSLEPKSKKLKPLEKTKPKLQLFDEKKLNKTQTNDEKSKKLNSNGLSKIKKNKLPARVSIQYETDMKKSTKDKMKVKSKKNEAKSIKMKGQVAAEDEENVICIFNFSFSTIINNLFY